MGGVGPGGGTGGRGGGMMGIWGLLGVKLGGFVGLKEGEEGRNAGVWGWKWGFLINWGGGRRIWGENGEFWSWGGGRGGK